MLQMNNKGEDSLPLLVISIQKIDILFLHRQPYQNHYNRGHYIILGKLYDKGYKTLSWQHL
ncbi:hypothetical protein COF81_09380 [Bacillus pseudomycoides]|uniref:Uncharacterized protein n=1 Tax=Bacillus pseudomycoides TaxID=64104 RepID=A0ABD6TCE3_9BACI|nr:hypothetical protein COF81_09380 [Bacillus pseudomycoides]